MALVAGCGGTLTSADGYFQSPNYPFAYPHSAECFWLIKVSEGSAIRLTFTSFDIETHGYCEFDYVEVAILALLYLYFTHAVGKNTSLSIHYFCEEIYEAVAL